MAFKVNETFEVQAPVQRVWEYLIDPARVAMCLPGAELLESRDDQTYLGAVKVKVGPVSMSYKGVVKFTELDEEARVVQLVGEARETGGGGSAKLSMRSKISPIDNGGSQVVVEAEVDLVGKIVQFGRGMIEEVSRQLFRQFSECVKQHLEVAESAVVEEPPAAPAEALSATALGFRALGAIIARFFRRLFGKQVS
jgi:carbon monoxide dehydrogenase subunit G